jgi:hypothetical protein
MQRSRLSGLLRLGAYGSGTLIVLVLVGALVVDRLMSTEVLFIAPKPADVVKVEQALWEPGQPVAGIYGAPASTKTRVVLPDEGRLLRPQQDRTLVLMKVDKQRGDNPLQVKTVWFLAARAAYGLGVFGALALLGAWLLGRRRGRPDPGLVDSPT